MVALASRESILPLLRVLDRFEAMSNHRMNISKTMMLLLGHERSFDLHADEPAARALRRRRLERTYDITPGRDDRLPDKWHGIVLGNEAGTTKAWKDTTAKAGEMAESLHACTMPHGSKGRVALANGKLMGKAYATMRLTAPASQQAVDSWGGGHRDSPPGEGQPPHVCLAGFPEGHPTPFAFRSSRSGGGGLECRSAGRGRARDVRSRSRSTCRGSCRSR